MAIVIRMIWPTYLNSFEILVRTDVKPDGIVLALASGAAAVLSLATGLSSALVGMMVAVALLQPEQNLIIHCGSRRMTLKAAEIQERYLGERGRRGALLPRNYRKVDALEPEVS